MYYTWYRSPHAKAQFLGERTCLGASCTKMTQPIEMSFWVVESGGSKEQFIRCESRSHHAKGQFLLEKLYPNLPEDTAVSCA